VLTDHRGLLEKAAKALAVDLTRAWQSRGGERASEGGEEGGEPAMAVRGGSSCRALALARRHSPTRFAVCTLATRTTRA
jgi:hypothetical protein